MTTVTAGYGPHIKKLREKNLNNFALQFTIRTAVAANKYETLDQNNKYLTQIKDDGIDLFFVAARLTTS